MSAARFCGSCGAPLSGDVRFYPGCGRPVAPKLAPLRAQAQAPLTPPSAAARHGGPASVVAALASPTPEPREPLLGLGTATAKDPVQARIVTTAEWGRCSLWHEPPQNLVTLSVNLEGMADGNDWPIGRVEA